MRKTIVSLTFVYFFDIHLFATVLKGLKSAHRKVNNRIPSLSCLDSKVVAQVQLHGEEAQQLSPGEQWGKSTCLLCWGSARDSKVKDYFIFLLNPWMVLSSRRSFGSPERTSCSGQHSIIFLFLGGGGWVEHFGFPISISTARKSRQKLLKYRRVLLKYGWTWISEHYVCFRWQVKRFLNKNQKISSFDRINGNFGYASNLERRP